MLHNIRNKSTRYFFTTAGAFIGSTWQMNALAQQSGIPLFSSGFLECTERELALAFGGATTVLSYLFVVARVMMMAGVGYTLVDASFQYMRDQPWSIVVRLPIVAIIGVVAVQLVESLVMTDC